MKFISSIFGLMAVFCVFGDANAALRAGGERAATNTTGRVSMAVSPTTAAIRRLPTVRQIASTASSSSTSSSSESSLMDTTECVDAYTECIKAADVCGADFEECTTHELFYAQKPQCNNVLLQCSTAGINTLFGTTSITNLTADNMEVYPTQGSILGQFIEAGRINNRLDKGSCVKRYTSCLHKESVCGEDFELCTSDTEFRKQKIFCESTLVRCTDDGKTELFGSTDTDRAPSGDSRLRIMITEGAQLAANNAVSTCYKVASQCFLNACSQNPYRCIINSSMNLVNATDKLNDVDTSSSANQNNDVINASSVSRYLRGACEDTIGGNKYCHMTTYKGKVPTPKDLIDENLRDEVYSDIYASVMNSPLRDQIQKNANSVDTRAKDKCRDTIKSCAMRSCGGGLGSACYTKVFGSGNCFDSSNVAVVNPTGSNQGGPRPNQKNNSNPTGVTTLTPDIKCSINGDSTYLEIRNGCEAIVNTDQNCLYALASINNDAYNYAYNDANAFTTLFPTMSTRNDPINAVTTLNAILRDNYNDAAIEKMADNCRADVEKCITDECGEDFTMCYRNRSDIMSDTYATSGDGVLTLNTFDKSMNKVGGILDFTVVRGLCIRQVQDSSACKEHLSIQVAKNNSKNGGWGGNTTVGSTWNTTARGYTLKEVEYADEDDTLCIATADDSCSVDDASDPHDCGTTALGCKYDQKITYKDYLLTLNTDTLFREVLDRLEKYVQGQYNAKLTKEQNMCRAANSGGIMGRNDMTSTYMWVKLKSKRVPKNYSVNGLKENEFTKSNDLYGSFCRARVTVQSDDPDLQRFLQENSNAKNWSTAYFAVGDVFTCGSWIPQKELEKVATIAACKKAKAEGTIDSKTDCGNASENDKLKLTVGQQWAQWGAAIGGAGLMGAGMDLLQTKTGLGGLLNTTKNKSNKDALESSLKTAKSLVSEKCTSTKKSDSKFSKSTSDRKSGTVNIETYWYNESGDLTCEDLNNYINRAQKQLDNGDDDKLDGWRLGADTIAGAAGGLVSGIGVHNALKAQNQANFTAAQQEFMNNVGNHIYCFIGADEAGTYGDLIEISVD